MFEALPVEAVAADGRIVYRRGALVKHLPEGRIVYAPLPPVFTPGRYASHMMIEFPVQVLAPGERRRVYLKFPIDVGVFLERSGRYVLVDAFSLARVKYALYCDPGNGVLARWWRSDAYTQPPMVDPDSEGLMELEIANGGEWAEVSRAVFSCGGMPLYYSSHAAVKARMEVKGRWAETYFLESPPLEGMARAPDPGLGGEGRFEMRCGI